jgi:hypothetical protein
MGLLSSVSGKEAARIFEKFGYAIDPPSNRKPHDSFS